jgi:hypothetical protein
MESRFMLAQWDLNFPGCEPVAHWLREVFPNHWVRFHSLPGSKRYPENEDEYRTVIDRQHCVINELLGLGRKLVLLTTEYSQNPSAVHPDVEWVSLNPGAKLWRSVPMHPHDGSIDLNYWHVFASEWDWPASPLDQLLRLVADDIVRNVMLVACDCRWVAHPYDGGLDVVMESEAGRNKLRSAHPAWLSARSDGL